MVHISWTTFEAKIIRSKLETEKKNIAQVVYQVHDMKYHVRKKETPSMISKIPKHAKNISPCV